MHINIHAYKHPYIYNMDTILVIHVCVNCNALSNYLIILLDDMVYVYILYGF